MAKQTQFFTVRNRLGQYLGTFSAYTDQQAIAKMIAADRSTGSTFRKSQPATPAYRWEGVTAKVETRS